jgi:hypothetical protein
MTFTPQITDADVETITRTIATPAETQSVAQFKPGPGIARLELKFDIDKLREALEECLRREAFMGEMQDQGFAAIDPKTRPDRVDHQ